MRRFVILIVFLAVAVRFAESSHGAASGGNRDRESLTKQTSLFLNTDQTRYSLSQSMVLNVGIRNIGPQPLFVYGKISWGYGGGLVLRIKDQSGKDVAPVLHDDTMLPPPHSLDDPNIFVRLLTESFFGTRRVLPVKDVVKSPGKYTLQVEYNSPLSRSILDPKMQQLPALWHEDASIYSNTVTVEITP